MRRRRGQKDIDDQEFGVVLSLIASTAPLPINRVEGGSHQSEGVDEASEADASEASYPPANFSTINSECRVNHVVQTDHPAS